MTLTEFLLARINEDEAVALNAMRLHLTSKLAADDEYGGIYIGRARILAECEAKRRIVEAYRDERTRAKIYQQNADDETSGERDSRIQAWARQGGLEIAVSALALPYADHPDYQQEWKP